MDPQPPPKGVEKFMKDSKYQVDRDKIILSIKRETLHPYALRILISTSSCASN